MAVPRQIGDIVGRAMRVFDDPVLAKEIFAQRFAYCSRLLLACLSCEDVQGHTQIDAIGYGVPTDSARGLGVISVVGDSGPTT